GGGEGDGCKTVGRGCDVRRRLPLTQGSLRYRFRPNCWRWTVRRAFFVLICAAAACDGTTETDSVSDGLDTLGDRGAPEPPMAGIHWARGEARPPGAGGSPPPIYHGGPVMTQGAYVEAIFWGTSWSDSTFVADKETGLASFYGGMGNSKYDLTNSEYTDATGAGVGSGASFAGSHVDLSAVPRRVGS